MSTAISATMHNHNMFCYHFLLPARPTVNYNHLVARSRSIQPGSGCCSVQSNCPMDAEHTGTGIDTGADTGADTGVPLAVARWRRMVELSKPAAVDIESRVVVADTQLVAQRTWVALPGCSTVVAQHSLDRLVVPSQVVAALPEQVHKRLLVACV